MQQLLDRFVFRIGPTTVAFVKSTDDDRLWCAHTMRQSSFRRLCVQQKTKIAWCVPGLTDHDKPLSTALVVDIEMTALTSPIVRAACRWVQTTTTTAFPGSSKLVFYTTHAFYVYIYILSLTIIYISIRMLYYF